MLAARSAQEKSKSVMVISQEKRAQLAQEFSERVVLYGTTCYLPLIL
jgi:hypothetical protein